MRVRPLLLFVLLTLPVSVRAQWVTNGAPVCTTIKNQINSTIAPDGSGGAFMAWVDYRNSAAFDIYAQRIDANGKAVWTTDGIPVCVANNGQFLPAIIADGNGGAIVAWHDGRNGGSQDIYAQRFNASGVPQWTIDGVVVCAAPVDQFNAALVSDGAGGAIVSWMDWRTGVGTNYDIYVQRINSAGVVQWTANGVAVCTAPAQQYDPRLCTDGAGGAYITWQDYRSGNFDMYAQRVTAAGNLTYALNGYALSSYPGDQWLPAITADGAGGAIIAWQDARGGTYDIYAQHLTLAGGPIWDDGGTYICVAANSQNTPTLAADGAGGAIIAWDDSRGASHDIYAQHITSLGALQWQGDGVSLCSASGDQTAPKLTSDGKGGAMVTWLDTRGGSNTHVYAQRVNASGLVQWASDGIAVCTAANNQSAPAIVSDPNGNAIVGWFDGRSVQSSDIYAQRIEWTYGFTGHPEPALTSVADIPHDQGGKVAVNWKPSPQDAPSIQAISHYSIWRAVDTVPSGMTSGSTPVVKQLRDVRDGTVDTVYISSTATGYYWELVGTQTAHGWEGYSFSAETRADSVAASAGNEAFMVAAHYANSDFTALASNVVTGHSVDNLAPPAPLFLTAQRVGNDVHLKWNGVHLRDLDKYTVYRTASTGVTAIPANFLADNPDTIMVDASAPGSALYYVVTATDIHQNQGLKSNEASVAATTGVGNLPSITALTVLQNHPNPFTGETELRVGLPSKSDVRVEIFDVAGRRVRDVMMPSQTKGWNRLRITALDDHGAQLASGVYFYKVHAGAETVTSKMVIAR